MKRKYYWDQRFDNDGYMSYPDLSFELIDSIKQDIRESLKLKLHEYLKPLNSKKSQLQDWFMTVTANKEIRDLIDQYLELDQIRFMKYYGSTKVHPELIGEFITLRVDIHEYMLRPMLSILREYGPIETELKAKEERSTV